MRTTIGSFLAGFGVILFERPASLARHVARRTPQQHGLGRVALFPPLAAASLAIGWPSRSPSAEHCVKPGADLYLAPLTTLC